MSESLGVFIPSAIEIDPEVMTHFPRGITREFYSRVRRHLNVTNMLLGQTSEVVHIERTTCDGEFVVLKTAYRSGVLTIKMLTPEKR